MDKSKVEAPGSTAELIEALERISRTIGVQLEFISIAYPGTKILDAGPILRNMRRYKQMADEALAKVQGGAA